MSDMVMNSSRMSQKNPLATIIFVRRVLYQTCMKNKITSDALMRAMASATKMFQRPRSTVETKAVTQVSTMSAKKTRK